MPYAGSVLANQTYLISKFRSLGATDPTHAISESDLGIRSLDFVRRQVLSKFIEMNIVSETAENRFFLNNSLAQSLLDNRGALHLWRIERAGAPQDS